ncbi:unnamed protein product, partial [Meganyctiphanes norvegica]
MVRSHLGAEVSMMCQHQQWRTATEVRSHLGAEVSMMCQHQQWRTATEVWSQQHQNEQRRRRGCGLPHAGLFMAVLSSLFFSLCSLIVKVFVLSQSYSFHTNLYGLTFLPVVQMRMRNTGPRPPAIGHPTNMFRATQLATTLLLPYPSFRKMILGKYNCILSLLTMSITLFTLNKYSYNGSCIAELNIHVLKTMSGLTFLVNDANVTKSLTDSLEQVWDCFLFIISISLLSDNFSVILQCMKSSILISVIHIIISYSFTCATMLIYSHILRCIIISNTFRYYLVITKAFCFCSLVNLQPRKSSPKECNKSTGICLIAVSALAFKLRHNSEALFFLGNLNRHFEILLNDQYRKFPNLLQASMNQKSLH